MTSTKLIRLHTDPLNNRLTTAEGSLATIASRNLLVSGDNVSELNNDAQYQTLDQVNTAINNLIDSAPGTLDTLGEIAAALADDDSAIAALTTVNTTQNTAIAQHTTSIAELETSFNELDASDIPIEIAPLSVVLDDTEGGSIASTVENLIKLLDEQVAYLNQYYNNQLFITSTTLEELRQLINTLIRHNNIRRYTLSEGETLQLGIYDVGRQNLINQTSLTCLIELPSPSSIDVGVEFLIINHSSSTQNIIFAGETITPGSRHAVQWDGVEWVVL